MKVAIFGIGLIGSAIANEFDASKHEITLFDITKLNTCSDVEFCATDYKDLKSISWDDFEVVVLTIGLNSNNHKLMKFVNCDLCESIINSLNKKTKLLFLSSSAIYSNSPGVKLESDEGNPDSEYGLTKLYIENLIRNNLENYIIVRPFNVYGDYNYSFDNVEIIKKHSIVDEMVSKNKIKFLKTHNKFVVRDFVSTKFIGEVIVKLSESNWNKDVVNICSGFDFDYENYYKIVPNEEFINNDAAPHIVSGSTIKLKQLMGNDKIQKQVDFMKAILND